MKTCFGRRASSSRSRNSVAVSCELLAALPGGEPGGVDLEPGDAERRLRRRRSRAPQHRLHARHELGQLERLRHVVVGAELEPDDDVMELAARRQHHDRRLAVVADLAQHLEAVERGQHHVEHDQVDTALAEAVEPLAPVADRRHPAARTARAQASPPHGSRGRPPRAARARPWIKPTTLGSQYNRDQHRVVAVLIVDGDRARNELLGCERHLYGEAAVTGSRLLAAELLARGVQHFDR